MQKIKRIIIGSDHAGFALKEKLKVYLKNLDIVVKDIGTYSQKSCDYPDFAASVAGAVASSRFKRGILICKSGIGNSIVANRFPNVRAALCYNAQVARLSREHNDSNVLVLGSSFVNETSARDILKVWLNTEFQGARHTRRLNKIKKIEAQIRREKSEVYKSC